MNNLRAQCGDGNIAPPMKFSKANLCLVYYTDKLHGAQGLTSLSARFDSWWTKPSLLNAMAQTLTQKSKLALLTVKMVKRYLDSWKLSKSQKKKRKGVAPSLTGARFDFLEAQHCYLELVLFWIFESVQDELKSSRTNSLTMVSLWKPINMWLWFSQLSSSFGMDGQVLCTNSLKYTHTLA